MALYNDGIDRAFTGVRILDFTHVQAGPTLTQLFAFWGADCIKVERPGVGDITRAQLRDIPGKDSLYFTMLNGTKRSITLDTKIGMGNEVLTDLIKACDVIAENFGPGVLDRMGFTWERIQEINPRIIYASVKGFGEGPFQDCKVYENIAQCAGGGASTTGDVYGPPTVSGPQVGDSGTGLHVAFGIAAALYQRTKTGRGQRVQCSMQDSVINLCRVKYRDQQRLTNTGGPLNEYPQFYLNIPFGKAVPRAGNASGGGQPGWVLKCKGWETDPDAYTYFITQAQVWPAVCDLLGKPEWKETYKTPDSRLPQLKMIFDTIEQWTMQRTKYEVMEACNKVDIPVGPILSCKEVLEDESLYKTGTFVRVNHPDRGEFVTVGNPIKLSDSPQIVLPSPALGQHTEEVLAEVLGYNADKVSAVVGSGCTKPAPKK